mmetsp:Transcript_56746/g.138026  ORF Transcript_56746/g.138026 Transcript_56746/m.138026 type:complete len:159 (-) Transcript_56746:49-525(-)
MSVKHSVMKSNQCTLSYRYQKIKSNPSKFSIERHGNMSLVSSCINTVSIQYLQRTDSVQSYNIFRVGWSPSIPIMKGEARPKVLKRWVENQILHPKSVEKKTVTIERGMLQLSDDGRTKSAYYFCILFIIRKEQAYYSSSPKSTEKMGRKSDSSSEEC